MKHLYLLFFLLLPLLGASAQHCCENNENTSLTKKQLKKLQHLYAPFSVLGDSYSTFDGFTTPRENLQWYPQEGNDITDVNDTWWKAFSDETGIQLDHNNSFSGATVCYRGYNGADFKPFSFITRASQLGQPKLIVVEGATNDSWAGVPMGEYTYQDPTEEALYQFRPGLAKLLSTLQKIYPKATIVFMLNSELSDDINASVANICRHYHVPLLMLQDVDKQRGHPSRAGMKAMKEQLIAFLLDLK